MNPVLTKIHKIRDTVNKPWQQDILLKDRGKWLQLCACMDVIEDTQVAIDDYAALPDFSAQTGGYLYLYGLLQALFVQQDAICHLTARLTDKKIDWETEYPDIYNIRELRNDAVGHPTDRNVKKERSFHPISRPSICKSSFDLVSYYAEREIKIENKNVNEIIEKQGKAIDSLLDNILTDLKQKLKTHKMKFKGEKIIDKIPAQYGYCLAKIGEGISSNHPLAELNFDELKRGICDINTAIAQRYGSIGALPVLELELNDIEYILQRFDEWISSGQLFGNKDAGIFLYALSNKLNELKEFLEEIDNEFLS